MTRIRKYLQNATDIPLEMAQFAEHYQGELSESNVFIKKVMLWITSMVLSVFSSGLA